MTQADETNQANEAQPAASETIPPMPKVPAAQAETKFLLAVTPDGAIDHYIGYKYRHPKKGGAFFAVVRGTWYKERIVSGCHPATEEGWRATWKEFATISPHAAVKAQEGMARQAEANKKEAQLRALERKSLAVVSGATFLGGYKPHLDLAENSTYDLRFLPENLGIFFPHRTEVAGELAYSDFSNVQIGGPGLVTSISPLVAPAEKIAAAAIQIAQPNSSANLLAVEQGAISATLKAAGTRHKIQTILLIQAKDAELFFLSTDIEPNQLRISLSPGLGRIREVLDSMPADRPVIQDSNVSSVISQLDKAAALMDRGLLTREEFQALKSRLLADS